MSLEQDIEMRLFIIEEMLAHVSIASPEYLTRKQAAEILHVAPETIDLWCRTGKEINGRRYKLDRKKNRGIRHTTVNRFASMLKAAAAMPAKRSI